MKPLVTLCACALLAALSGCVTPVVSIHKDPFGVCAGLPFPPVDLCLTLRQSN